MGQITCTGKDGIIRTFDYSIENYPLNQWIFRVTNIPPLENKEFFELAVIEVNSLTVRVVMANHNNIAEYAAKGIPEALLPKVKSELGRNVESSPSQSIIGSIYRKDTATKYWKRLCQVGGATYDKNRDIYKVT